MALDPAVAEFLNEKRYASLATVGADGAPHQSVMWFALDGDRIMMNTKRGRVKDRNLARNPKASICVEDGYRYVTISGTITMDDDQTVAQRDIHALGVRYEGAEAAERMADGQFRKETRVTLYLSIDKVDVHGF